MFIRYQIMLKCWEEEPRDRPTFVELKDKMKEMERNHKVNSVLRIFKHAIYKKLLDAENYATKNPPASLDGFQISCWRNTRIIRHSKGNKTKFTGRVALRQKGMY